MVNSIGSIICTRRRDTEGSTSAGNRNRKMDGCGGERGRRSGA